MRDILLKVGLCVYVSACAYLVGPANAPSATDWVTCPDGVQRCHVDWELCSTTRPYRCVPKVGVARDAGRD